MGAASRFNAWAASPAGARGMPRQIAKALGVDHKTVGKDIGEKSPHGSKNVNQNKGHKSDAGEKSPRSGTEAARIVVDFAANAAGGGKKSKGNKGTSAANAANAPRSGTDAAQIGGLHHVAVDSLWIACGEAWGGPPMCSRPSPAGMAQ